MYLLLYIHLLSQGIEENYYTKGVFLFFFFFRATLMFNWKAQSWSYFPLKIMQVKRSVEHSIHLFLSRLAQQVIHIHDRSLLQVFYSQTDMTYIFSLKDVLREGHVQHTVYWLLLLSRFCIITETSQMERGTLRGKGWGSLGKTDNGETILGKRNSYPVLGKGRFYCWEHNFWFQMWLINEWTEK